MNRIGWIWPWSGDGYRTPAALPGIVVSGNRMSNAGAIATRSSV